GRQSEYTEVCQRLVDQFAPTTTPRIASAVSRICLVTPGQPAGEQAEALRRWLALIGNSLPTADPDATAGFQLTLGLRSYRMRDFDHARERLQAAAEGPVLCRATAQLLLAMVQHDRGDDQAARSLLAGAQQAVDGMVRSKFAWWDEHLFFVL